MQCDLPLLFHMDAQEIYSEQRYYQHYENYVLSGCFYASNASMLLPSHSQLAEFLQHAARWQSRRHW